MTVTVVGTCLVSLGGATTKRIIHISCHTDQGAKTSKGSVNVNVLFAMTVTVTVVVLALFPWVVLLQRGSFIFVITLPKEPRQV
jgi:hypothetical protein